MNWFDFAILGVILLSTVIGIWRGFVREALSLAGWVLSIWLAFVFAPQFAELLAGMIDQEMIRYLVAFLVILVVVLLLAGILTALLARLVDATGLKGTDRSVGLLFGAVRGALLVAILVLLAGLTQMPEESWWQESMLLPPFIELATWLAELVPQDLRAHVELRPPTVAPLLEAPAPQEPTELIHRE